MKNWFKRSQNDIQRYLEEIKQLKAENRELRGEVDFLEKKYRGYLRINEFKYYNELVCSYENVHGKTLAVIVQVKLNSKGKLVNLHFQLHDMNDVRSPARWHTHIDCDIHYDNKSGFIHHLFIEGCQTREPNMGYGSLLMEAFLDYVSHHLKVDEVCISGWLSPVDERSEENKQRRNHFYEKFGFEIRGDHIYKTLACNQDRIFNI